jgi:hypothetical protein
MGRNKKEVDEKKQRLIRENWRLDYKELAEITGQSVDSVRKMYRRLGLPPKRTNIQYQRGGLSLDLEAMKKYMKSPRTIEEICDRFVLPPKKVRETISELQDSHHVFEIADNKIRLGKDIAPNYRPVVVDFQKYVETEVPFGFVADNHLGSKYERLDILEDLYDRFQAAGVTTVYQGGNILDGECRYNKFDIYVHGVNDQVGNLVAKYPQRKGITTHFVTGDDHEGWYVQREHINIGEVIESMANKAGRKDLVHLGYMERDITLQQADGAAVLRVIHAGGGSAYAHSYTAQKYAESLQGGEKPSIVLVGHFHKYNHSYPREIHMIQGGCTEDQTPFMRKRKLQAMTGGVILWVKQASNGVIRSVKVEWIPYFDKKFYEYRW